VYRVLEAFSLDATLIFTFNNKLLVRTLADSGDAEQAKSRKVPELLQFRDRTKSHLIASPFDELLRWHEQQQQSFVRSGLVDAWFSDCAWRDLICACAWRHHRITTLGRPMASLFAVTQSQQPIFRCKSARFHSRCERSTTMQKISSEDNPQSYRPSVYPSNSLLTIVRWWHSRQSASRWSGFEFQSYGPSIAWLQLSFAKPFTSKSDTVSLLSLMAKSI